MFHNGHESWGGLHRDIADGPMNGFIRSALAAVDALVWIYFLGNQLPDTVQWCQLDILLLSKLTRKNRID